jgi:hypothetical protein
MISSSGGEPYSSSVRRVREGVDANSHTLSTGEDDLASSLWSSIGLELSSSAIVTSLSLPAEEGGGEESDILK